MMYVDVRLHVFGGWYVAACVCAHVRAIAAACGVCAWVACLARRWWMWRAVLEIAHGLACGVWHARLALSLSRAPTAPRFLCASRLCFCWCVRLSRVCSYKVVTT
eukprot:scaffold15633_cov107-Isochrysis_galbana.AAC.6